MGRYCRVHSILVEQLHIGDSHFHESLHYRALKPCLFRLIIIWITSFFFQILTRTEMIRGGSCRVSPSSTNFFGLVINGIIASGTVACAASSSRRCVGRISSNSGEAEVAHVATQMRDSVRIFNSAAWKDRKLTLNYIIQCVLYDS